MEGTRITTAFTTYMQTNDEKLDIKRTGLKWTTLFQAKLWTLFSWSQWTNINEFVLKINSETVQTLKHEEI